MLLNKSYGETIPDLLQERSEKEYVLTIWEQFVRYVTYIKGKYAPNMDSLCKYINYLIFNENVLKKSNHDTYIFYKKLSEKQDILYICITCIQNITAVNYEYIENLDNIYDNFHNIKNKSNLQERCNHAYHRAQLYMQKKNHGYDNSYSAYCMEL